jgi:enediyne biosynthesis thioesterase
MSAYEIRHVVTLEETNVVGNVYYANYVRWQGLCREMFLRDHTPDLLHELGQSLSFVTTRVSCEFFRELFAFDEVIVRMRAGVVTRGRVSMIFEYLRSGDGDSELVAKGEQQIACMRKDGSRLVPAPLPHSLSRALEIYAGNGEPQYPRQSAPPPQVAPVASPISV